MKKLFTLAFAILATLSANAQVDVTTDPALPATFDESWGGNFLIKQTGVSAGDKFIFTATTITATEKWTYGSQILPKANTAGWLGLGMKTASDPDPSTISVPSNGDYTFTLTQDYADTINAYGGLRIQGIDVNITAVKYQTATVIDPTTEKTYVFDVKNTGQLWSGTTNDGTGMITFPAAWAGAGWWIQDLDMTPYKSVVFELSEASKIQLLPQVFAKNGTTDANVSKNMDPGQTITAIDLPTGTLTYSTIMMQNYAAGTCKLKRVYLSSLSAADALTVAAGINNVHAEKAVNTNAPIYNLAGQKVSNDYKGIVIQNGKKFINK